MKNKFDIYNGSKDMELMVAAQRYTFGEEFEFEGKRYSSQHVIDIIDKKTGEVKNYVIVPFELRN